MSGKWYVNKRLEIATTFLAAYYANPESDLADPIGHFLDRAERLLTANSERDFPDDVDEVEDMHYAPAA